MQRPLAGLTRQDLVTESTAGVTLLTIAIPLNIGFDTNRAAVAALAEGERG